MAIDRDFEPRPQGEAPGLPEPGLPEIGDPKWVLDTWRMLYYEMPSPGLKKRVEEVERWYKEQVPEADSGL